MMALGGAQPRPRFARGSEWRRWDLHVHTPFSALNNGFGADFDVYASRLLSAAVEANIAAIGVTDYFSVAGYRAIRELLADGPRLEALLGTEVAQSASQLLILPNIELRATVVVRSDGADSRVNFHVIFSDELSPDEIETHFLRRILFTAEGSPDDTDERWPLTIEDLSELGRRLKIQHEPFADRSDLVVGMTNAVVSLDDVTKVLHEQPSRFSDRFLLVVPADEDLSDVQWDGQGHLLRKTFIQRAHMLFSANPGSRDFGLGRRHTSVQGFRNEFKTLKPCIHGSDAHDFATLFRPDEDRFCWIKADPTFRGLRQLLQEPDTRVFIGRTPDAIISARRRPTRIVESLAVSKVSGSALAESWFDTILPLNAGLCAVIGNKGSGKSALGDILALAGGTKRSGAFSFLNGYRFRRPREMKAAHFGTTLRWADGSSDGPANLAQNPDPSAVEKVRYIPQNYLEEICNEIGSGKKSRFYAELQQVIFSHVPPDERLGFATLEELLDHLGEGTQRTIDLLKGELSDINRELGRLLTRSVNDERATLNERAAEKQRELDAHERAKPPAVAQPDENDEIKEQQREIAQALGEAQLQITGLGDELGRLRAENGRLVRQRAAGDRILGALANLRRQVDTSLQQSAPDAAELGVALSELVQLNVNEEPLRQALARIDARMSEVASATDEVTENSVAWRRRETLTAIDGLEARLTAPQQEYQKYLRVLSEWEERRAEILGNPELPGSIAYLQKELEDLTSIPDRIASLAKSRDRKTLEIYAEKQRLRRYYETYHRPVQDFLQSHPLADNDLRMSFRTSIRESDFRDRFLRLVHQGRVGPWAGVEEGAEALQSLLSETDWGSPRSVIRFCRDAVNRIRLHENRELALRDQLVHGVTVGQLLDYVHDLDYLDPIYELKWDGKGVDELSPGERGNLLLVFYFLIDREDIPLIIDQPEENLDNHTVVRTLVPCVKDAKKRRQIVIVTHNPNLAVVCDAEQVVYCEIHKDAGNQIEYEGGSIEDPVTNKRILDVLEGTRPAFDYRDARYRG